MGKVALRPSLPSILQGGIREMTTRVSSAKNLKGLEEAAGDLSRMRVKGVHERTSSSHPRARVANACFLQGHGEERSGHLPKHQIVTSKTNHDRDNAATYKAVGNSGITSSPTPTCKKAVSRGSLEQPMGP